MDDNHKKKELVKQRYGELALLKDTSKASCCGNPLDPSKKVFTIMSEDYSKLNGYVAEADLGVGCGLPTQYAGIKQGDTVIDLGSGAGNDCFVARAETGESGRVIGIDFSPEMLAKAKANAEKRGFGNVEFRQGDIENMPVGGNSADVVISNCVLNLLPAKDKIFHQIFRVLKPDGHFCISDIVISGELPDKLREAAEMYVGCVAGAIPKERYMVSIFSAGFQNVKIEKRILLPFPMKYWRSIWTPKNCSVSKMTLPPLIISITVTGTKPSEGCGCGSGCC